MYTYDFYVFDVYSYCIIFYFYPTANLNISKLDSAYDIDPIFHKMSQKFDEGGAKGLLLVNLGLANDGCRIVLDSKEDSTSSAIGAQESDPVEETEQPEMHREEGMIDISCLVQVLEKKRGCSAFETIQLVPQLDELRQAYAVLEDEGFVEAGKALKSKSFRYANNLEEDKAAEAAIHREALERSTASGLQHRTSFLLPNSSMMTTNLSMMSRPSNESTQPNSNTYGGDDSDGGYDDYDDGDDGDFENFVAMDDHAEKYSSDSFRNDLTHDEYGTTSTTIVTEASSVPPTFLDEICEGNALTEGSQFNYFNPELIEKLTSGNQWAGSAHWKKNQTVRPKKMSKPTSGDGDDNTKKRKDSKRKTTKETKKKSFIDLDISSCNDCLEALLSKKKPARGKGVKRDTTQMTNAAKEKYDKDRNMLPLDAGITVKHFTEFFMRPGASLTQSTDSAPATCAKTVGFLGIDTEHFDDGEDDSYHDGPGFELADNDVGGGVDDEDYVVQELEGIRKVDKVRVSHATVAKKVDVKRLKKDLWDELETATKPMPKQQQQQVDADGESMNESIEDVPVEEGNEQKMVSFKETVHKLGASEAQEDVSLPFYFICMLHLANEKGLKLENGEYGLSDFGISIDSDVAPPTN
jgi:condensin complex subunit 2